MATATTDPVRLPPGPRIPKLLQTTAFLISNHAMFATFARRYGSDVVRVNLPHNNDAVVVCDPALAKDLFSTGSDLVERAPSGAGALSAVFGPGSTFSLAGDEHRQRRKLLTPPFRGAHMRSYERIIEDEVMREIAGWKQACEFTAIEPMLRITLGAILRAVFGAEGPALEKLREMVPPIITLGSMLAVCPPIVRRDLGPWSPWGRFLRERRRFDAIIASLIDEARADPDLDQRADILALLLQARYDNGDRISDQHIADELLTLLGSGHETTAASLAWALERLSRHPKLLSELMAEADAGGSELRQATIWEVQRTRPVLDGTTRRTKTRIRLGEWVLPEGTNIIISIKLAHESESSFADAGSFDPRRYLGTAAKPTGWMPFGGGVNRCVGAAFANMEVDVVLRMLLREFRFVTTDAPGEKARWRGVATVPSQGARAMVYRRNTTEPTVVGPLSAAGQR